MNRTLIAFMLALCSVLESEAQFHSLYFDGVDDHVELNETILDQHFSFEGWIRFAADGIPFGSDAGSHIVSIGAANDGTNWASFAVGVSLSIEGMPQLTCEFGQAYQYAANEAFPMGEWVHFAVVFDAGALHVYQNGLNVLSTQTPFSSPLGDGNNYFIGSRGDDWEAGAYRFHGEIAQISQWQVALSSSEIQALVGCRQTAQEEGLLSLWTFETGEGGVLVDQVGVNSGQIEGALWSGLMPLFYGCTDSAACNFDACANTHDESCLYPPLIDLGEDIETCEDSVTLDAGEGFGSYLWSTGETSQSIVVGESGAYGIEAFSSTSKATLQFSSSNQIKRFSENPFASEKEAGSITTWIKLNDFNPAQDGDGSFFINGFNGDTDNIGFGMHTGVPNTENKWRFGFYNGSWNWATADSLIELDRWYHLTGTWGAEGLRIYVDGSLDGSSNSSGPSPGCSETVLGGNSNASLMCSILEVAMWEHALDSTEIQALLNCPLENGQDVSGLLGYWNFESHDGLDWLDLSPYQNHLTNHAEDHLPQVNQTEFSYECEGACLASDEILVDFDDCDAYCGEGTVWDPVNQECVASLTCEVSITQSSLISSPGTCGMVTPEQGWKDNGMTLGMWIQTEDPGRGYILMEGNNGWQDDFGIALQMIDGYIEFDVNAVNRGLSETYIADGNWHALHIVNVGDAALLYIDGLLQQEATLSEGLDLDEWPILLGTKTLDCSTDDGSGSVFEGALSRLALWSRPLSIEEMQLAMNCGEASVPSGMVGYWPLEADSTGTIQAEVGTPGTHNDMASLAESPSSFCEYNVMDSLLINLASSSCGEGTVWDPVNQECIVAIPTDTDFDGCVTAGDLLNLLGTFGSCPPIPFSDPFSGPCQGQDHVTYQGYDYDIVAIGSQCWFAENLQAENYLSGSQIPLIETASEWMGMSTGGRRVYGLGDAQCGVEGDTIGYCNEPLASVVADLGYLYNWHVVSQNEGVCPANWHVPNDSDFETLLASANQIEGDALSSLKSQTGWADGKGGTNTSGFNALGSGYGGNQGNFGSDGYFTGFWSVDEAGPSANASHLQIDERPQSSFAGSVFLNDNNKRYAVSIRCVKDQ